MRERLRLPSRRGRVAALGATLLAGACVAIVPALAGAQSSTSTSTSTTSASTTTSTTTSASTTTTKAGPPGLSPTQEKYLRLAETGINEQSTRWRTSQDGGWYCEILGCTGAYPLLTIWGVVRMFESVDATELAYPSAAHRAAVDHFASDAANLYWNKYLNGYDPYPGDDYPAAQAWFDDNGWLGLAFMDAYQATGEHRWVSDAQRALSFIAANGWSGGGPGGGMWWNTQHQQKSGEALAADALLAMLLYDANRNGTDLRDAQEWIDWANQFDIGFHGLYDSEGPHSSIIDYVESPLIYGQYLLCQALHRQDYCSHAADQSGTLTRVYGTAYNLAPLYDSIFFQWMMAYDKATAQTHWIGVAEQNASAAMAHATIGDGLWLGSWWGGAIHDPNTQPGMFRTMAGTTSLYAWLAYYA